MIDFLFNTQPLPLILLGIFALAFLVQVLFYWVVFYRLARHRPAGTEGKLPGVSVVICAHNEFHHLQETLPAILAQDYPEFEVLVVDHSSDDDTPFLLARLEEEYPHLSTLTIKEDLNFFQGKKFPLSIGIRSAKHPLVLLTDADCRPASKDWIRHMASGYRPGKEIVLGFSPYTRFKGFLNRLIRFDTAHIGLQYLSYALAGMPYMGVGRNLSYRKKIFYENQGFISHYRIRSGDDDLFINRVARRSNTAIMVNPGSFTFSDPKRTFGTWITQKRRHLSTGHLYRFKHKFMLGLYSSSMVVFYVLLVLLPALNWSPVPVATLFILRLLSQYIVFSGTFRKLESSDLVPLVPVFELSLMMVNAGVALANLIQKPTRWK
ncbi:MAG TPA: glycosyltransferase [Bacteroidales bacterium]|nr:glycosyltransferase [Bacteroidales bacterium]